MSITLLDKVAPVVDELFKVESKKEILTNYNFDWTGAHTVLVYKVTTAEMQDYGRNRNAQSVDTSVSRFGEIYDLDATTEELTLTKDRSFIFNIDKLDEDETANVLNAALALARQVREVVVPEIDSYIYSKMVTNAGTTADAAELSYSNIYDKILEGSEALDNAEVPETERVLAVTPAVYSLMKKAVQFDNTDVGADMRKLGVIGMLDGMLVVKIPAARLPENFGFMIAHPSATVAPVKLADYVMHNDTVISSGTIVTGRVCYDAFVLDNKADGIYVQPVTSSGGTTGGTTGETGTTA